MILPYFGVISEIIPVFSRKPIFGYTGLVLAAFAIAGLSMGVWAHHMFTTGAVNNPFFSAVSFLIAVPTGVKFFNWIATMWRGSISFETPMLFAMGFLMNFLLGGVTGVMIASPPVDYQATIRISWSRTCTTSWAAAVSLRFLPPCSFGGPRCSAYGSTSGSARGVSGCYSLGSTLRFFQCTSWALRACHAASSRTRIPVRLPELNFVATCGSYIMLAGVIVFGLNVVLSAIRAKPAGDDPWNANSLEWATSSPPPEFNFTSLPPIRSERPVWDMRHRADEQPPQ